MTRFERAFLTGASSGLGAALARVLAARGTRVVLAARRTAELEQLAAEIGASGGRADVETLDVGDVPGVREAVARWDRDLGGLDLVIANAGVSVAAPARRQRWEDVETVIEVNVLGALATLHAALGPMLGRGRGTLVGVSSVAAWRGLPTAGAYSASKAALSTFLETLRVDLAGTGVTAIDVRPGFVRTPMTAGAAHPMPFLIDADDAARRALRGIERGRAVVAFPFPTAAFLRIASLVPGPVYRLLARALATAADRKSSS